MFFILQFGILNLSKNNNRKTLLGSSYSEVYVMTLYNTNIQWKDVAFVLWALVQLYNMIFPKFMTQFLTFFSSLSGVKSLQHVSYYLSKVSKCNVLTLKIKKGKFINWFVGPWLIRRVLNFDHVQIHELHSLSAEQRASEVSNITLRNLAICK